MIRTNRVCFVGGTICGGIRCIIIGSLRECESIQIHDISRVCVASYILLLPPASCVYIYGWQSARNGQIIIKCS